LSYLNADGNDTSVQMRIHALSVMFCLIEEYPKEAEEQGFTNQAIQLAFSQAVTRDNSISVS
jgi:hypothetical protein